MTPVSGVKDPGEVLPTGITGHYLRDEVKTLNHLLFALVLGCRVSDNPQGSVLYEMINKGAHCTAGFSTVSYVPQITTFHLYFWELAMGHSRSTWLSAADKAPGAREVYDAAARACELSLAACTWNSWDTGRAPRIHEFDMYPSVSTRRHLKLMPARHGVP